MVSMAGQRLVYTVVLKVLILCPIPKVRCGQTIKDLMPQADDDTPRYVQLARNLASAIQAGAWKPNEALPAERELCEQLNVSRVTLRQALDAVAEQTHLAAPGCRHLCYTTHRASAQQPHQLQRDTAPQGYERARSGSNVSAYRTAEEVTRLGLSRMPNSRVDTVAQRDGKSSPMSVRCFPCTCCPSRAPSGLSVPMAR